MTEREILLSLCASLTLADHMGDVSEDVIEALRRAGITVEDRPWPQDVTHALHKLGVKTLYGTELGGDDK